MFIVRCGTTRIAFVFFRRLVIKIPAFNIKQLVSHFKKRKSFLLSLREFLRDIYRTLLWGTTCNITEALIFFHVPMSDYLVPIFTIGICSFQAYMGEEIPTQKEIETVFAKLPPFLVEILSRTDNHERCQSNWRKRKDGSLCLIDYASNPLFTPWAVFLISAGKDLDKATTHC